MSDVVDDLREWADAMDANNPRRYQILFAADTIERLRDALEEIKYKGTRKGYSRYDMAKIAEAALTQEKQG